MDETSTVDPETVGVFVSGKETALESVGIIALGKKTALEVEMPLGSLVLSMIPDIHTVTNHIRR